MNRIYKTIIVIVIVLAAALGIMRFLSFSNSTVIGPVATSSDSAASPISLSSALDLTGVAATQVIQYEPSQPASSTPVAQGSCWTNSIAAPFRDDAWRCTVGNSIEDPCFQIPGTQTLLCGANPANPAATSTFVLQLTQDLPKSAPVKGLQPADQVWLIELRGGTLCSPFTGTLPFTETGDVASFGCAPGSLGRDVDIFNINSSGTVWIADIGTLTPSTSSLPTITASSSVPITTVWR
ncbi:MAG: hypothetical protein P4L81_08570 [Candidatus Pacebacteria bacterium]|nr:hypothetical protein [Candidatus Paceibacterota bacterium]